MKNWDSSARLYRCSKSYETLIVLTSLRLIFSELTILHAKNIHFYSAFVCIDPKVALCAVGGKLSKNSDETPSLAPASQ